MAKSSTLGLTPGTQQAREFHCRNCNQLIHESNNFCPNCAATVDIKEFNARMDVIGKVAQAATHIGYLKVLAFAIVVFYAVSWVPTVDIVGYWACLGLLVAVPLLLLAWWLRYGRIKSDDPDLIRARRSIRVPVVIWVVMLIVWIVAPILYLEYQLNQLSKDQSAVVAFKDVNGMHWAVPCVRIKERKGHTIIIDKGTFIARGSGDASSKSITETLMYAVEELYEASRQGRSFIIRQGNKIGHEFLRTETSPWSGESELTDREIAVEIKEVVRIKKGERPKLHN